MVDRIVTRIEVVESASDFAALRDEWNELLAASTSDCLFLTWEWLHTWWVHLGQGKRLFIVTVRSGSQLIAIAPLTVTRTWAVSLLEFAGTGIVGSDYLDFIVRSGHEREALNALVSFLVGTGFSMRLSNVKEGSAVAVALSDRLADRRWRSVQTPVNVCPFIDLSAGSWDSYLSSIGPKHRYNLKRRLRNLNRDFAVRFVTAESEEERREALATVVRLHLLRWTTRSGQSEAFNDPRMLAFHDEMSRLALERGWLRLSVLKLDERAVAAFYGFRYGRTFYFYQSGFDPAFERYSVGHVTLGMTIRSAIEEGASEYDMLHGNEAYKSLWTTQVRRLVRLELYPPGATGRLHRNTVRVIAAARRSARSVLRG